MPKVTVKIVCSEDDIKDIICTRYDLTKETAKISVHTDINDRNQIVGTTIIVEGEKYNTNNR